MKEPDYSPGIEEVLERLSPQAAYREALRQQQIEQLEKKSGEFFGLGAILMLAAIIVGVLTSSFFGWLTFLSGVSMTGYGSHLAGRKHRLMYFRSGGRNEK